MKTKKTKEAKARVSRESCYKKNTTDFPLLVELCKLSQCDLSRILPVKLSQCGYKNVVVGDGFIYARGEIPVLLTAHMDTVHKQPIVDYYEEIRAGKHIISSPQGIGGDDRCGIYMILQIIQEYKCSVLFCEDEEIGAVGSSKFCRTKMIDEVSDLNYIIGLDRKGHNDAVFYDCNNPQFTDFIIDNTGFNEDFGTFSDISIIAPISGVAAVNLSCGYYFPHTKKEQIIVEDMLYSIEAVKILLACKSEKYEYIENEPVNWSGWNYSSGPHAPELIELNIRYYSKSGEAMSDFGLGSSVLDAWADFFGNHPEVDIDDVCGHSLFLC